MTKKNLKPQLTAPVQREINATSSLGGTGLIPLMVPRGFYYDPFAGEDAE